MDFDVPVVGLADAIDALRSELIDAAIRGDGQAMRFSIEPVELTVEVNVTKDVNGKIGWHVLEAGANYQRANTQTLKLILAPLWLQDDGELTSNFAISSASSPNEKFGPQGPAAPRKTSQAGGNKE